MHDFTLKMCGERLDYARSIAAFIRCTISYQDAAQLDKEATFGLYNLIAQVEDLLTAEINEQAAKRLRAR